MKTRHRIIVLLLSTFVLLALSFSINYYFYNERQKSFVINDLQKRQYSAQISLILKSQYIDKYVIDYTYWDELVDFINTPDTSWADDYLGSTLSTADLNYLWIFNKHHKLIYYVHDSTVSDIKFPLQADAFNRFFDTSENGTKRFCKFYARHDSSIILFSGGTIHFTDDPERKGIPNGYLFTAKLLDSSYVRDLSIITNSTASIVLSKPNGFSQQTINTNDVYETLTSWEGKDIGFVKFSTDNAFLQQEVRNDQLSLIVYIVTSLTVLLVIYLFIKKWIYKPVKDISHTLDYENPVFLNEIINKNDEFGKIARLTKQAFEQRDKLVQEISARRQAETIILRNEAKFRKLIMQIPDYVFVIQNNKVVFVNHAVMLKLGYSNEQLQNARITDIIPHSSDVTLTERNILKVEQGEPVKDYQIDIRTADNSIRTVVVHSSLTDYEGHSGTLVLLVDITDNIKTLESLRESEQNYRMLINNLSEGIVKISLDNRFFFSNRAAQNILGFPAEILHTKHITDFINAEQHNLYFNNPELTKYVLEFDIQIQNGTHRHLVLIASPNISLNGKITHIDAIIQDMTQHRQLMNELQESKDAAERAYNIINEKNKSITDSIRYAQNIQKAILPQESDVIDIFAEAFVLYRPKDIVSGDFYWIKQYRNYIFVAASDCTGHGVPGGFMSMMGIAFLNEIISTYITQKRLSQMKSGEVLDTLRNNIIMALRQTGRIGEAKDGMDMSFCCIDVQNQTMQFSGAQSPALLIRNGKIVDLQHDNMPIGITYNIQEKFKTHVINLYEDDIIYLFSDGYKDQIGGVLRRKFFMRSFRNLLLELSDLPMKEQKKLLEEQFDDWRGNMEQMDDLMVLGIKIKFEKIGQYSQNVKANILVVDDEEANYLLISEILLRNDMRTIWAENGRVALELIQTRNDIHLAIVDISLPDMSGYDVVRQMKKHIPNLPLMVLTGHFLSNEQQQSIEAGCDEFLTKPVRMRELVKTLQRMLKYNPEEIIV